MNKNTSPIYILGINESHCATAALLKDGKIIACASEERFTRIKNQAGLPIKSITYCLQEAGISIDVIQNVYFSFRYPSYLAGNNVKSLLVRMYSFFLFFVYRLLQIFPFLFHVFKWLEAYIYNPTFGRWITVRHFRACAKALGIPYTKICQVDHHISHAFAAYYSNPQRKEKELSAVVTCDGRGDGYCSKVFTVRNNVWRNVSSTLDYYSPGWLYEYVTKYLGMKAQEHEYKVMGLAAYVKKNATEKLTNTFRRILFVDDCTFAGPRPLFLQLSFLDSVLSHQRFDTIAGSVQLFTEELLCRFISNILKKTKAKSLVLGGGVFMNVKANMELLNLPQVSNLFVMPSAGDESTAVGAAYFGYKRFCETNCIPFTPYSLETVYLGCSYSNAEIKKLLMSASLWGQEIRWKRMHNINQEVALLLAKGKIVARFSGRMEYGARALGNRSILADPRDIRVIKTINDQIKLRDFWMPFAPVILKERQAEYLVNPKGAASSYMMMTFVTTEKGRRDLTAAMHQYDFTVRPQILSFEQNPMYYKLIQSFEKITGVGALLNTSFNLHGEPIVCTPEDAISTFIRSGLEYLALEDYLLEK